MSILDGHRTPPPKKVAAKAGTDVGPLGAAFAELVAAKVAEQMVEVETKADARIQAAMERAVADAKKAGEEAEDAARKRVATEMEQIKATQRKAEESAQRLTQEKAKADGLLEAERVAHKQAESRFRAEVDAAEGRRRDLEKVASAAAQRIETLTKSLGEAQVALEKKSVPVPVPQKKEIEHEGYDFQFHYNGGEHIVGATATPRKN